MAQPQNEHSKNKQSISNEDLAEMIDALARTTARGFERVEEEFAQVDFLFGAIKAVSVLDDICFEIRDEFREGL